MQAYASHKMKDIYDVNQLDLKKVASAFGLAVPPRVNLNVKVSGQTIRKHKAEDMMGKKKARFVQGHKRDRDNFSYN